MTEEQKQAWKRFIFGYWTKEKPSDYDTYYLGCTSEGHIPPVLLTKNDNWKGFWWSEPLPVDYMPKLKVKKEKKENGS